MDGLLGTGDHGTFALEKIPVKPGTNQEKEK
jgi:hypothetical protein